MAAYSIMKGLLLGTAALLVGVIVGKMILRFVN